MRNVFIERWEGFNTEQRISFVILCVCGALAIVFSVFSIGSSIHDPFLSDRKQAIAFKQSLPLSQDEQDAKLRRTDTDGDGLSDWDEIHVYHTNPNLKDSCGDGIPDNIRVLTGVNLDCSSKSANLAGALDTSAVENATSSLPQAQIATPSLDALIQSAGSSTNTGSGTGYLPRDPAAIRAALVGRVDQAQLDALTDDQLLQYYDTAIAQMNNAAAASSTPSTTSQ